MRLFRMCKVMRIYIVIICFAQFKKKGSKKKKIKKRKKKKNKKMTWTMMWLNRSVATLIATLQLLDIYRLKAFNISNAW